MSQPLPIVYFSSSNNTKYAGELIVKGLEAGGYDAVLIPVERADEHADTLRAAPFIGLGSPVYGGLSEPMAKWAVGFDFTGKKVFLFFTAAMFFLDAAGQAADIVEKNGGTVVGSFGMRFTASGDGIFLVSRISDIYPLKRKDLVAACAFGRDMARAVRAGGAGYSRAGPGGKALQFLLKISIKPLALSALRRLAFGFSAEKCIACKKCESQCPTGAISIEGAPPRRNLDYAKCACCFRCFKLCPTGALRLRIGRKMEYYRGPWQLKGYVTPEELASGIAPVQE